MLAAIHRTWNRVRNSLAVAKIAVVNDSGPVQTAQITIGALEVINDVPIVPLYGYQSNPPPASNAMANFIAGARSNGAVTATVHTTYRKRNLAPGEVAISDNLGRFIYLSAPAGIVIEANNAPVTISNATAVTINASTQVRMVTPLLQVTGNIVDNCDTQTESMAGQRGVYNGHTHPVPNVQTGDATVTTEAPNQPEP